MWEKVAADAVALYDILKVKFSRGEGSYWSTCEVWLLKQEPQRASVIYHEDGYAEDIELEGDGQHAYVRLKEGVPRPSVLLQAKSHDKYLLGMAARSSPINPASAHTRPTPQPMLVLPDPKVAKVFDAHQTVHAGGCQTVIRPGWRDERPRDLIFLMAGKQVKQMYVLVGHSHGYAVDGRSVSYPSDASPTRLACRLERIGRHPDIALQLGAKDGGVAKQASDVMIYELPASMELRILPSHYIHQVRTHQG